MKSGKILFGIFILLGAIKEGYSAMEQGLQVSFFIILVLIGLVICGLLFRSAYNSNQKKQDLIGQRDNSVLWKFLKIFSIFGILGVLFSGNFKPTPKNIADINGMKIPLDKCVNQTNRNMKNIPKSIEFCECIANKLANNADIAKFERENLKNGNLILIINKYTKNLRIKELGLDQCFTPEITKNLIPNEWSDEYKAGLKLGTLNKLKGSEFEITHNSSDYCDCLIEGLVNYPIESIASGEFYRTLEFRKIDSLCQISSIK